MKSVLVFRTHKFDARTALELRRLQTAGLVVVVAADERFETLDTLEFPKASLTEDSLNRLGLASHPNVGWLCGDYALYLAAELVPDADQYWSIDRDVRINFERPADFFSAFADLELDFLGVRHEMAPPNWYWLSRMEPHRARVYQTLFGTLRVSRRAVTHLLRERRALSGVPSHLYPNDESFVASVLANDGFTCGVFRDRQDYFPYRSFALRRVVSGTMLDEAGRDNLVHHAVLYGEEFAEKAVGASRRPLSSIGARELVEGMRAEFGRERSAEFAARLVAGWPEHAGVTSLA